MPNVSVIQLSDLHFGAGGENVHPAHKLLDHVAAVVKTVDNPLLLASGDITYQARESGYREATQFFERLLDRTGLSGKRILFCPGNHDCDASKHFQPFDAFTYGIRRDELCTFSDVSCRVVTVDGLDILLMNSSHHLDHKYGLVDVPAISKATISDPSNCLAVTHHHLIPSEEHDPSTTRNAYDVLAALDERSIPVLLHGHQHTAKGIAVGMTPVRVLGVNSFNFHFKGGQNAVGVLEWRDDRISFSRRILLTDGIAGAVGRYQTVDEVRIR